MNFSWVRWRHFLYLVILGIWSIWFVNLRVLNGSSLIAPDCDKDIKEHQVAIVLGARVFSDNKISDVYADRLQEAVNIYKNNKVSKILVSGDHGQTDYDEVNAGKNYLLDAGVTPDDIFLDHAGFDTYDSVYRAKNIFGINNALIITQRFHLPRALYLGNELNLDVLGCSADLHSYQSINKMKRREILARVKAWADIAFNASPKYQGDTFDINGDGRQTWDTTY